MQQAVDEFVRPHVAGRADELDEGHVLPVDDGLSKSHRNEASGAKNLLATSIGRGLSGPIPAAAAVRRA